MKRRDLERELQRVGCELVRHGGSHDVWVSPSGRLLSVPRHREIKQQLARALIRAAQESG